MPEPRTSQDLFNKVADIIDFTPHKYNQGVWGNAGTQYIGIDPSYVEWDNVSFDHDELYTDESELKEETRVDDACGTQACVAGWACLLSGYHPTMVESDVEEEDDRWGGSIMERVYDRFTDAQRSLRMGGLKHIFSRKIGFNYNVMCDKPNVDTPINPHTDMQLNMEDIPEEGIKIGGNMFYRPDLKARLLLDLNWSESSTLFDGEYEWEAEDLRHIGKGEDIDEILAEKWGENRCEECEEYREDCDC